MPSDSETAHTDDALRESGEPVGRVQVPGAVMDIAKGSPLRCVWTNGLGGLTFELTGADRFIKWAPPGVDLRLMEEAERLRWAAKYSIVPEVVDVGTADDGSTWLLTIALHGKTAVAEEFKATPRKTVRLLGEALRALHDSLPVETCPFTWSADERAARAGARATAGLADPRWWDGSHQHLSVDEAMALVAEPPPIDELVVCHGDACSPNTLIDSEGRFAGHVDLGYLGTADRWADLAIATWATTWNYGPGWERELLAAYGIEADEQRTRYYRLLWDLGD